LLRIFSIPAYIIYILLYIPVSLFTGISSLVIRFVFRKELPGYTPVFGRVELDNYVRERMADQREDAEEVDHELEIFKNALEFSARKAREFMIPRTEIVALEVGSTIDEMRSLLIETGYSKALVYQDSIDKIIGYAHAFELFRMPTDVRSILRPVSYIPESMRANEILDSFTREKRSMAIVIDEFGGTSGMITLEDVVEEIFGEIEDEHDTDEFIERKISDTEYIFSSRLEIDYLNDEYNLGLPESDNYTTLGGLIFDVHESIPEKNEVIEVGDFTMTIREVSDNRIEEVLLKINEPS
jgi:CBS domain containing-hemolysin-like protein